ncbi:MAG: sodium:solute symporter family protein [Planctomycetota bacterium]|jgi:SSS family transporter
MKTYIAIILTVLAAAGTGSNAEVIQWSQLPDLPDALGVAGAFSGVSSGALIVAGGANFPEPLFKDNQVNPLAKKVWWDHLYVLAGPDAQWQTSGVLPRPLAYGASVTTAEGVICIGGSDADRHYSDVFMLLWTDGRIEREDFPALPRPCANTAAAMLGTTIYVAGGQESPDAREAMKNFWALDLSQGDLQWVELDPWPGAGRILPVAAAQDSSFFLFSGCRLLTDEYGSVQREYLTDAYRFTPGNGGDIAGKWKKIADVPAPVVAAPTPAISAGQSHILVLGGDHGKYATRNLELMDRHPGFSTDVLAYHTITDTWTKAGTLPAGHVTAAVVEWGDNVVIPSGEIRPGMRSPKVFSGTFSQIRSGFGWLDYLTWGVYLVVILCIGLYFAKREKGTDDFFFGGKRVCWWAAGISIFGTQLSAITFMAIPAKVYATDWVYILAQATIIMVAPIVVFFYLPFFRRLNISTAYEYLEMRFNVALRLLGGIAFCLMQLGRMGIVLFLPAVALATVTDFNVYTCILVMGIFCTIYTVMGGIEAVIWTDVIQVFVLMGGALLCVIVIALKVDGGLAGIVDLGRQAEKFRAVNLTWDYTAAAVWVVVLGNLLSNLVPYSADQTVIQRYLTTPTEKQAARAIWTNAVLTVPAALIFFFLGTALYAFYRTQPQNLNPTVNTDAILPWFVVRELPIGIAGVVLAAIFAAAMSSLDSSMNSMATVLVTDFYHRFKPGSSDHTRLKLARIITVVLGVFGTGCALLMATYPIKSLWDFFLAMLGLLGGGLAGLFILGIFTRRANSTGAPERSSGSFAAP